MLPEEFDPNAAAQPGSGIFGLPSQPGDAGVVLVPVPWDATTSYRRGTALGPRAILAASRQVDLHDVECGEPWRAGIAMLDEPQTMRRRNTQARQAADPIIAAGGAEGRPPLQQELARVETLGGRVNEWIESTVEEWFGRGRLVGVVGGDHSAAYGSIRAVSRRHPGLGVLHLDAHADLRPAFEGFVWSHASVFHNVLERIPEVARLVQVGVRDLGAVEAERIAADARIATFFDSDLARRGFEGEAWDSQCVRIVQALPGKVYLSFDVDGLDPSLCPHTGTPVPGGLSFGQVCHLLRVLAASGRRIEGFDLCEVAPGRRGDWDANVGARLLYRMIGYALLTRGAA